MIDRRCFVKGAGLGLVPRAALPQAGRTDDSVSDGSNPGCRYVVTPENPPNDGMLFVDHSPAGRSGHLGHALVEYGDGRILAFYPNCSGERHNPNRPVKGHSARGWMEFKRSQDGGAAWSAPSVLAYSKNLFDAGQSGKSRRKFSAFAEKAVRTDDGQIVLFFLVCDITENVIWRQFQVPTYISSSDGGHTWSEPSQLCDSRGRVYDARNYNGEILALHFKNDNEINFLGNKPGHVYELHASLDGGRTFARRSELPFDTIGKSYGTMQMLESGRIVTYIYDSKAEDTMNYVVSDDGGRTWSEPRIAQFAKRIRNGQMASVNGCYFMHGRSGSLQGKKSEKGHLVLYSSLDGLAWDDGVYLKMREEGIAAYSNSVVVGSLNPRKRNRLLVQASHAYEQNLTSVYHWWIDTPA